MRHSRAIAACVKMLAPRGRFFLRRRPSPIPTEEHLMTDLSSGTPMLASAGARFRAAVAAEKPLQIAGTINAYHARMAERVGFEAIYLSGGGVAAGSLG